MARREARNGKLGGGATADVLVVDVGMRICGRVEVDLTNKVSSKGAGEKEGLGMFMRVCGWS